MRRAFLLSLVLFLLPASALAAAPAGRQARVPVSFSAARSLLLASSSPGNAYAAGASIVVTAPISGDFSAAAGSVVVAAPVFGDALLLAGSADSRAFVSGDFRTASWNIDIEESIAGDLVAFGYSVYDAGRAGGSVFIIAANAILANGAVGPVTIYGNNISLAGDFSDDVNIVASGRVSLAENTSIRGTLFYEAPDIAVIPPSATIGGGVEYTNASYLPDIGTSRVLAAIGIGLFLVVRILGAIILTGLLAGLFPELARAVVMRAYAARPRDMLLTALLGFAALAATPILLVLLSLTFVGLGLALLLFLLYALLALLSALYAGILLGGIVARRFAARDVLLWRDGALGMLALSLLTLVPFVGMPVALLLAIFSAGALLRLFFNFAFPRERGGSPS